MPRRSQASRYGVSIRSKGQVRSWICLTIRAGLPATTAPAGTSRVTTDPAPTRANVPITTPGRRVAFAPIFAPGSMVGPLRHCCTAGHCGCGALVRTARGPTQLLRMRCENSGMKACEWTRAPSSMVTWCSITVWLPMLTRSPMVLVSRRSAPWPHWKPLPMVFPA